MAGDNTTDKQPKISVRGRPFPKGVSGNPKGRPKGKTLTEQMRDMLESRPEIREALIQKTIAKALEGDPAFTKLLWGYLDGMPQQKMDVTSQGEKLQQSIVHYLPTRDKDIRAKGDGK